MMTRTKLADRKLPDYTKGEEITNMVTHIVGGAFGIVALVLCLVFSIIKQDSYLIAGSAVYGSSLILLYTMSSVYHGLGPNMGKKVMQVIDHCTIYYLIGGTYTPIVLGAIRKINPVVAWVVFGVVWAACITACVFTAIDLKKYAVLSMICYIGVGWCIIFAIRPTLEALGLKGFLWVLAGGIVYTVGAVLYGLGRTHRYMHSVFHVFVLLGTFFQFVGVFAYVILK
ncbi:MAG: hemolysin III family protein [Lachnospiraceae bacterium]|nr:hemolysin III family protein [Lachnospiraceae bacterium]